MIRLARALLELARVAYARRRFRARGGPPDAALAVGLCPSCLGARRVERVVPVEGLYRCATCGGSGRWPPPVGRNG